MKNLSLISFVGVDTNTNLEDIEQFESKIPCEFSVLFSETKSLTKDMRYPSYDYCSKFLAWGKEKKVITSLHLCGSVIERYLSQDPQIIELCNLASRIQLNLNIATYPNYEELTQRLLFSISENGHHIILQQNKTKQKFMDLFLKSPDVFISLLHDSSGGFGREISKVDPPYNLHFTGYAGGIKPDNVKKIVDLIELANIKNEMYYIDMESGVREDNIFSITKCQQVIANLI